MRRTKIPLLIWRRRRSWRILRGLGAILLILRGCVSGERWRIWSEGGEGLPLDADDEDELRLGGDVEGAILLA